MLRANIFMTTSSLFLLCQIIISTLSLDNAGINKCYNMWFLYVCNEYGEVRVSITQGINRHNPLMI